MLCLPNNPNIGLTHIPRIVLKLWGKGTLFVKSDWSGEAKIYYEKILFIYSQWEQSRNIL